MFSVVVLTYNSIKYIKTCLNSLFQQSYPHFEVILVDNGSQDGTVDFVKGHYNDITLLENKENRGAAYARNQGIAAAVNKWVLSLDCDVVLEKDFLLKAHQKILTLPIRAGMVQPKIMNADKITLYSCGVYLSDARKFYDIGRNQKDSGQFDRQASVFGGCSAACFYKREMLEDLKENTGYFDERFFFLVEDVDLSWRAQKKGWKAVFYPEAVCCHLGNSSDSPQKLRQYLCFRNRYYSIKKNEGLINYSKNIYLILTYDLPRLFYLACTNRYIYERRVDRCQVK